MKLWPRLPLPRARAVVTELHGLTLDELKARPWMGGAPRLFAPTGGVRVDDGTLRRLRGSLEECAAGAGYPHRGGRERRARFDSTSLRVLADCPIPFGEAIRAETWAWVTVILVPHLVRWRWSDDDGKVSLERYAGPLLRNALGRLWYQAVSLDRGAADPERWMYADQFGADQAVALLERPRLASSQAVCLSIARAWAALPVADRKEELFRETMKALLVRSAVQRLDVLDVRVLDEAVAATFVTTMGRLGLR